MKAKWNNTWIADESARMFGLTVNGRQIVQEAQFLRAAEAAIYGRKNRSLVIQFSTTRIHGTIGAAEEALFNHWPALEDTGTLLLRIGAPGEASTDLLLQNSALEGISWPSPRGVALQPQYTFRCPGVSGITATPAADELVSGTFAIASGASQVAVTGLSLAGVPVRGFVDVRAPSGGRRIYASIVDGTFSAAGFTADLSAVTPATGYKLDYALVL